jgi:hypothetical protein
MARVGMTLVIGVAATSPLHAGMTFKLRPIMRQGTASSISETWNHYTTVDEAKRATRQMYHDDRVLRVFVVTDEAPPRFVEWIER